MYASHGWLEEATQVFTKISVPNTFVWASIISAHAEHSQPTRAIQLYRQMLSSTLKANNYIFVAVLKACTIAMDLHSGKEVHADILGSEVEPDIFVANCLVDMYAKCGSLVDARRVFNNLPTRDVVTGNAILTGYAQRGLGQEALNIYASMQQEGMQQEGRTLADRVTFISVLQACGSIGALHHGKKVHAQIQERGLQLDVGLGNCLVDMYAKCGSLEDASKLLDTLPSRDVVIWTALLNGYAQHSDSQMAIHCFEQMRQQGVEPDCATFICLLVACSHEGLVDQDRLYFRMMVDEHDLTPTILHYNCMVDLLGRSGRLKEAEDMLQSMPFQNDVVGWTSLLNACKSHGDLERGRRCFNSLVELEPENSTAFLLLGNMYAKAGRWRDVERLESLRKSAGAWKKPARAWIEVENKVRGFTVGEESADVSSKLRSVNMSLEEGGHVPHTDLILKALSQQEKEDALCGHAEKLALAYGLLNTPGGTTLLVMVTKNLRVCNDCHVW